MKAIVAVDNKWGIGKKNGLLFILPKDMDFFRKTTLNKIVVMGSNTLKSFPGGNPLKNRINIVLWPQGEPRNDCIIVEGMDELKTTLSKFNTDDVYIIGGAMFYRTMLPYCDTVLVTKVDSDGGAEVFFENLDKLPDWEQVECGENIIDGENKIKFTKYKNNRPQKFI